MDVDDAPRLRTRRLELIAATVDAARAAAAGPSALAQALEATVPDAWPPAGATLAADDAGWGSWFVVDAAAAALVGTIGFRARPDAEGAVELGYAMLPAGERFAKEAVGALVDWAFASDEVRCVRAAASSPAAARVFADNGLRRVDEREGVVRLELARS